MQLRNLVIDWKRNVELFPKGSSWISIDIPTYAVTMECTSDNWLGISTIDDHPMLLGDHDS